MTAGEAGDADAGTVLLRGEREELPARRPHESFDFALGDVVYTAGIGRRPADLSICEVFLNAGKDGSMLGTLANDAAILVSLLIQYGCPLHVVLHAMTRNPDARAAGQIGAMLDRLPEARGDAA